MDKFDYWQEPDTKLFRIRHIFDEGNNRRIVGHVALENEAKLFVAALNSSQRSDQK